MAPYNIASRKMSLHSDPPHVHGNGIRVHNVNRLLRNIYRYSRNWKAWQIKYKDSDTKTTQLRVLRDMYGYIFRYIYFRYQHGSLGLLAVRVVVWLSTCEKIPWKGARTEVPGSGTGKKVNVGTEVMLKDWKSFPYLEAINYGKIM